MKTGVHQRAVGEYIRPTRTQVLVSSNEAGSPDDRGKGDIRRAQFLWAGVRGIDFHKQALKRTKDGQHVATLVPEPLNKWDHNAVSIDVEGRRIGYVPSRLAYTIFPHIRQINHNGFECLTLATLSTNEYTGDRLAYACVPTFKRLESFAPMKRIQEPLMKLWQIAPEELTKQIEKDGFHLTQTTAMKLWSLRREIPDFPFASSHESLLSDVSVDKFLRDQRLQRNKKRELAARRKKKQKEKLALRRQADLQARDEVIIRLARAGESRQNIATQLKISASTVSRVVKLSGPEMEEPSQEGPKVQHEISALTSPPAVASSSTPDATTASATHDKGTSTPGSMSNGSDFRSAKQRARKCLEALRMKQRGMTEKQISKVINRSTSKVRKYIRDAEFYISPSHYPQRTATPTEGLLIALIRDEAL